MQLAPAWETLSSVRARFRRGLLWLQFPIPKHAVVGRDREKRDPHTPTTRALELNYEVLDKMLDEVSMEFLDINRFGLHGCGFD